VLSNCPFVSTPPDLNLAVENAFISKFNYQTIHVVARGRARTPWKFIDNSCRGALPWLRTTALVNSIQLPTINTGIDKGTIVSDKPRPQASHW